MKPEFKCKKIRSDFPILDSRIHGHPLIYLDNAATTQKPSCVIDRIKHFYEFENANVRRGIYRLSQQATSLFEGARDLVKTFINAPKREEIIFVSGTTEAVNLVASAYLRSRLSPGDEIIISHMEHHSNIVPWQIVCQQTGALLKVISIDQKGELLLDHFESLLSDKTKLISVTHVSNVLGTINPIEILIQKAHALGIPVFVDGAQAVSHMPVDVTALDCDFYAFSSHKMMGPTGVGVLYGKKAFLESMEPYQGGGDMISSVTFNKTIYNELPYKFEAGTPPVADVIGLAEAILYLNQLGLNSIAAYEAELLIQAEEALKKIPGLRIIGEAQKKGPIVSFVFDDIHAHDVGTVLDQQGIAIRAGHHCAMPLMDFYQVPATIRASFAFYNTPTEIEALISGLRFARELFS